MKFKGSSANMNSYKAILNDFQVQIISINFKFDNWKDFEVIVLLINFWGFIEKRRWFLSIPKINNVKLKFI